MKTLKECSFCRLRKSDSNFGSVNGIEACGACLPSVIEKVIPRMYPVDIPESVFRKLADSPTRPPDVPCDEDDDL